MAMTTMRQIFFMPIIFYFNSLLLCSWPPRVAAHDETQIAIMYLDVLEAKVPSMDGITSASDTYIKISLKCTKTGTERKVGETNTVYDNDNPVFNQTFKAEKVDFDSILLFDLLDRDLLGQDDTISTVTANLKQVLLTGKNYKDLKLEFSKDNKNYYLIIKLLMIGA